MGSWQAIKDIRQQDGMAVFTLPKGAIIAVTSFNTKHDKILVERGAGCADWFPVHILDDFEMLI